MLLNFVGMTNLAALRLMAELAPPVERRITAGPGWLQVVLRRQRPLPAPGTAGPEGLSEERRGQGV